MLLFVCLLFRLFFSIRGRDALHTRLSASILKLVVASYAAKTVTTKYRSSLLQRFS